MITPRTYLGEELCAALDLCLESRETAETPIVKRIFGNQRVTTPLWVKSVLAKILVRAKVKLLLHSEIVDLLRDRQGRFCGVVVVNRSGRQVVMAKTIIDAGSFARSARLSCPRYLGAISVKT